MSRRVAIFADVHGMADQLKALMGKVRSRFPDVEFYSLGDLCDRGSAVKETVDLCIQEGVKGILGNHDEWMQKLCRDKTFDGSCLSSAMHGHATIESYSVEWKMRKREDVAQDLFAAVPDAHKQWFSDLPPFRKLEVDGKVYWLIHGGVTWNMAMGLDLEVTADEMLATICADDRMRDTLIWNKPNFWTSQGTKETDNVFPLPGGIQVLGHTTVPKPIVKDHFVALDTGCGARAPYTLSALVLPNNVIVQQLQLPRVIKT